MLTALAAASLAVPPLRGLIGGLVGYPVLVGLAGAVTFVTARFVWRQFVMEHDRLTYPRSVGVGLLIGVGSTIGLGIVLTLLIGITQVVGHVLGVEHVMWHGIGVAVVGLIGYTFFFIVGIVVVTLGLPLVLPVGVCVWLTRRSRRNSVADSTTD